MYDSGGVNGCDTVGNGALHYVLQLMGRVWCYGERLRARYHNHLATLYHLSPFQRLNPLPSPGIRCGRPIRPSAPYGPKRARLGTRMHTGVPGGVPGVSTVRKVCVTSLDCRALARSVRCSHGASHPDNMLKIWATRAARAAQGSLDAYKTRVERLTRCRQGLHGLPDPPSAASENQHCGKVHSHRGPARVRRAFRDDPLGWPSRPEDPDT